jgi:hypothetical protein
MRSVIAVIAGYGLAILLVFAFFGIRAALLGPDAVPGTAGALASLVWAFVVAILAGWLTARLAPSEPMRHAVWLIALSVTVGVLFTWVFPAGSSEEMPAEPLWLQLGNLLAVIVGVPIGARLAIGRSDEPRP